MLQMHVQVNEYVGCFEVRAVISDTDDRGDTHRLVSIPATMFDPVPADADEVTIALYVVRRWAELQINPGVSSRACREKE